MPKIALHKVKRKKGDCWCLRWFGKDGKRYCETIGSTADLTKRNAKLLQREKQSKMDGGTIRPDKPKKMTLDKFAQIYKIRRAQGDGGRGYVRGAPKLAATTIESHGMTLRYLIEHFGENRLLESIALPDAEAFVDALEASKLIGARTVEVKREWGMGPQNVRKHIRNCKTIYNWAILFGFATANPFVRLDSKPLPTNPNHYLPQIDFERIIERLDREIICYKRLVTRTERMLAAASPNEQGVLRQRRRRLTDRLASLPGWRVMFALCRLGGLRRGEALMLPWSGKAVDRDEQEHWVGVDWNKKRIHLVAVKTKMFRVIPIRPRLLEILVDAFNEAEEGAKTVTALTPHNMTRQAQAIVKAAGLTPWPKIYQAMRSSCENDLKQQGVAEATYAVWMGHSIAVSRQSYTAPLESEFAAITQGEAA